MSFRTPTGQTGLDAYRYEAAAIANAARELTARMRRLTDAIASETADGPLVHEPEPGIGVDIRLSARWYGLADAATLRDDLRDAARR